MSAVTFVARPAMYCVRCGHAVQAIVDAVDPRIRALTCLNAQCVQYSKTARVADPTCVLLTHVHDLHPAHIDHDAAEDDNGRC